MKLPKIGSKFTVPRPRKPFKITVTNVTSKSVIGKDSRGKKWRVALAYLDLRSIGATNVKRSTQKSKAEGRSTRVASKDAPRSPGLGYADFFANKKVSGSLSTHQYFLSLIEGFDYAAKRGRDRWISKEAGLRLQMAEEQKRATRITHSQYKAEAKESVKAFKAAIAWARANRPKDLKITDAAVAAQAKKSKSGFLDSYYGGD